MSTSQGVIFLKKKNVNEKSKWFEDGDEDNDGKYIGEIENGKPNGTGSITFPDGRKHVGEFKDGLRHGEGILTSPNGSKYEGEWKDDKKNGHGTVTLPHGQKYEGELKDDKFWNGTDYDKNGNIIESWLNGVKQK